MSARRVLVVSEPMEYGVLSYLEHLLDGLDRASWEPVLAHSPFRLAAQARRLVERLRARGVHVIELPFRRGAGPGDARAALRLRAELRALRPAVMHLHSTKAGLAGRLVARAAGVPVVYTPHGTSWHYTGALVGRCQRALERALRRRTDLLLAVCPEEADAFVREIRFPPDRVRVVRNGVRVPDRGALAAMRHAARTRLGLPDGSTWLLFVGRLTREKGLDVLLAALRQRIGADGLFVVGDGAERPRLEAAARACAIPVRFAGYRDDVSPFLAAGDVLVQPSRSEGLPFSVLEAMGHGLPIVASRVGGVAAAVGTGGRTVPGGDVAALAACLRDLLDDPAARAAHAEAARARAEAEFGLGRMLGAIQETYADAAGTRARGAAARPARAA